MTALTKIDYLGFRSKASPGVVCGALERLFGQAERVELLPAGHGRRGYSEGGMIALGGMRVGQYATGGESQRGWSSFELEGGGCGWVPDWRQAVDELEGVDYELRRGDIALDTWRGEMGHDQVVQAHAAGMFNTGGRMPKLRTIEGWPRSDGWTAYVGSRQQAKFFRGYDKGLQQAALYASALGVDQVELVDGVPAADWYRCELELKAKDRALPEDLIERRDEYFGGAYPFCQALVDVQPLRLTVARERRPQLELAAALGHVRQQWGRTLFTALLAHQGDIGAVWAKIVGDRHSPDLVEAGVLLVDHDEA